MVGELIGHYKILQKLGAGGMGEVYLADDTKLPRKVVLKFLPKDLRADTNAKKRFQFEAQAIAALNHPNIITIHENDEYSGRNYFVMEFVDGGSLKERMTQFREIPDVKKKVKEIINVAIQICRGLEKAHQANIIHRDIKPGNILLNTDGHIKIMDFGLAKLIGADKLTKEKYTMGTGHYMSPEQISGEEIDHRTDIWSLGVVLYEILSGELPFSGDYIESLFYSILSEEIDPISKKIPSIPPGMERIINKCLEKDVKNRYGSITEILIDLKQLKLDMDSGETATFDKKVQKRLTLFNRPAKLTIPVVIVALLLLFILVPNPGREAVKKWFGPPKIPVEKHLVIIPVINPEHNLSDEVYCRGTTQRIINKLNTITKIHGKLWIIPTDELLYYKISNIKKASEAFRINLGLTIKTSIKQDIVTHTLNLTDTHSQKQIRSSVLSNHKTKLSAIQDGLIIETANMLAIPLEQETHTLLTSATTSLPGAYELFIQGLGYLQLRKKKENINQAITLFSKATAQDERYVEALHALSKAYMYKYQLTPDKSLADKAISYCNRIIEISKQFWPAYVTKGMIFSIKRDATPAIEAFQQALKLHPDCSQAYLELAFTYHDMGQLKKAEEAYKKAIEMRPGYWKAYENLAYFYYNASRHPEAEEMYKKVIELNPANIIAYYNLIGIYTQTGNNSDAYDMFKKSLLIKPHYKSYSNMGYNLFLQKKFSEARDMFEKAIELGAEDRRTWGNLAEAYRYIGGHEKRAKEVYEKAIEMAQNALTSKPKNSSLRSSLALYLSKLGNFTQAIAEIEKALQLDPSGWQVIYKSIIVFELANRRTRALQSLRKFVERAGPMGELSRDLDLSALRQDPRYQKLVKSQVQDKVKTNKKNGAP